MKFIISQLEDYNSETFLSERASAPLVNGLRLTVELDLGLEKSWKTENSVPSGKQKPCIRLDSTIFPIDLECSDILHLSIIALNRCR